ncbi:MULTISPECIES: O-methyltransferase [unclassified Fusibacter]|uniref:O-methyltransferase n=1 Tax=unclassified Fusibacter TaxID=2624464 RepID=UPI001010DB36|nr:MULTISPECIES: O-methyltransferase [unclassified Fusibacter]MCK8058911.1 O-methyltransferase [Fusibacter sp. A2]NPE21986.1 O-methyltransferase [Fusibacter sp. A1]RXV61553.1 O-methyltransferase [Fusibacter sp. A1]
MSYIDDHVLTYVDKKMNYIEPQLVAIRELGLKEKVPIITNDAAAFLRTQIILKRPTRILEVGTAIGFSGSLMLLNCGAHLTTIEISEKSYEVARNHFKSLNLTDRVQQYLGDASEVMSTLVEQGQTFDFIFIDAAKGQYLDYFHKAERLVASGGMILTDNVLFKGITAGLPFARRQKTIYTRLNAFVDYTSNHKGFYSSLMTVGDGIMLSIRKD